MKSQKYITIITSIVAVIALSLAIVYHCCGKEFESNILIGVFSSGFLAMLVSIVEYADKRKDSLEKFYSAAHAALHNVNQYRTDLELEVAIEKVLSICNYDYSDLDMAYGAICFFFRDKETRKYIYDKIYEPILRLRKDLVEIHHHLSLYKDGVTNNETIVREMVNKVTNLIMDIDEFDSGVAEDTVIQFRYAKNRFFEPIEKELNGRYWKIMYLRQNDLNEDVKTNNQ